MEFIDHIIYINLDKRIDRRKHIEENIIPIFGIEKVTRLSGIEDKHGSIGCAKSHIAALELSIINKWNNVLILEDDVSIQPSFYKNLDSLKKLLHNTYDVILLGGGWASYNKITKKVYESSCCISYIVNKSYYYVLLHNFKESLKLLNIFFETNHIYKPREYEKFAIDYRWKILQKNDNWFILNMMTPIKSYSDITNTIEDYSKFFVSKTNILSKILKGR